MHLMFDPEGFRPFVKDWEQTAGILLQRIQHEAALDGEVRNAADMMQKLAASDRVRQSFVRHAFRYWMGRNEMLSDSPTLIAADEAYVAGSGSFKAMVIELLTSDSFLYRR